MTTWESRCCDPACPGWAVFNENEIQCCDACDRFADDREALDHVITTAEVSRNYDVTCDGIRLVACEFKGNAWILSKVLGFDYSPHGCLRRTEYPMVLLRADRGEFPDRDVKALLELVEYSLEVREEAK